MYSTVMVTSSGSGRASAKDLFSSPGKSADPQKAEPEKKKVSVEAPAASTAKASADAPKKEVLPSGRIIVVSKPQASAAAPAAAAPASGAAANAAVILFTKEHKDQKEAIMDFTNLKMGNDVQLRSMGAIPLTASNFTAALKNGVLLWYVFLSLFLFISCGLTSLVIAANWLTRLSGAQLTRGLST